MLRDAIVVSLEGGTRQGCSNLEFFDGAGERQAAAYG